MVTAPPTRCRADRFGIYTTVATSRTTVCLTRDDRWTECGLPVRPAMPTTSYPPNCESCRRATRAW